LNSVKSLAIWGDSAIVWDLKSKVAETILRADAVVISAGVVGERTETHMLIYEESK